MMIINPGDTLSDALRIKKLCSRLIPTILIALMIQLTSGFNAYTQDHAQNIDSITIHFEEFNKAYPQEKIYLHFDKSFYIPGETIWFKAYYVNASGNTPASLSNIMYTELIGVKGEVIIQRILEVGNGTANGEFLLPDSLPQGQYQVRAYTNWMRNFDEEYFFSKEILLFDPQKEYDNAKVDSTKPGMLIESIQENIDLQFFPEGGYLVSGLRSKIAFKAINGSGKGIYVKGDITDQYGNIITSFESFHLGMGSFFLKSVKGKTYYANINQKNDKRIKIRLPDVSEKGLAMAVDNTSADAISVLIQANEALLKDNKGEIFLVLQAGGLIYYTAYGNFNNISPISATIPKKELPAGIAQLTLFNGEGNPECERLVFINPNNALQVKFETDKKAYKPREKVHLDISVIDSEGHPAEGNFSLAVTDAGQVINLEKNSDNILSNLLLTSELKGIIEQPAFYFIKNNARSETALDHLMLTQGWRRFLWKEILNDEWPTINYDFEKNVFIRKGQVIYDVNDTPETLMRVSYLMLKERKPYNCIANDNGIFHFLINANYEEESVFFDVTDIEGQRNKFQINVENDLPEYQWAGRKETLFMNTEIQNCLKKRREKARIESAFDYSTENRLIHKVDPVLNDQEVKINSFFETADYTIRLDEYNSFPTMVEVFREIVTHVSLKYKKGENIIRVYSDEHIKNFERKPLFLVDDIPTYNKTFVLSLDPGDVETIEVINANHKIRRFGFLGQYGVIAITTKKKLITSDDIPDNNIIEFQGCYRAREFYSPDYSLSTETDRSKPDLRSLIYWNPLLKTDSIGKASVTFYNTDNITTVDIKIEGISQGGTPGLAAYQYQIIPRELTAKTSEDN